MVLLSPDFEYKVDSFNLYIIDNYVKKTTEGRLGRSMFPYSLQDFEMFPCSSKKITVFPGILFSPILYPE